MVKKSLFQAVGGLNAQALTVAYNDVDLCLKVGALGYTTLWTPYAQLIHHESVTRGKDHTAAAIQRICTEKQHMQRHWQALIDNDGYYSKHRSKAREDYSLSLNRWWNE